MQLRSLPVSWYLLIQSKEIIHYGNVNGWQFKVFKDCLYFKIHWHKEEEKKCPASDTVQSRLWRHKYLSRGDCSMTVREAQLFVSTLDTVNFGASLDFNRKHWVSFTTAATLYCHLINTRCCPTHWPLSTCGGYMEKGGASVYLTPSLRRNNWGNTWGQRSKRACWLRNKTKSMSNLKYDHN